MVVLRLGHYTKLRRGPPKAGGRAKARGLARRIDLCGGRRYNAGAGLEWPDALLSSPVSPPRSMVDQSPTNPPRTPPDNREGGAGRDAGSPAAPYRGRPRRRKLGFSDDFRRFFLRGLSALL